MKNQLLVLLFFICLSNSCSKEQHVLCESINHNSSEIVDEWNHPGRYSPYNVLDNDLKTCFAMRNNKKNNTSDLNVIFKEPIILSKIKMTSGYTKNKTTFENNHRIKSVKIEFLRETDEEFHGFSPVFSHKFELSDRMAAQEIILPKKIKASWIKFVVYDLYPTKKDRDVCISMINLYDDDKQIKITNLAKVKERYLNEFDDQFKSVLTDDSLEFRDSSPNVYSIIKAKNNELHIIDDADKGKIQIIKKFKWKVENHKLYFSNVDSDKWYLIHYTDMRGDSIDFKCDELNLNGAICVDIHNGIAP